MIDKIINPEAENLKILAENTRLKDAMEFLIKTPQFALFRQHLQEQYDLRIMQVLQMPTNADDVIQRTYVAGEISTFRVIIGLPELYIEGAKEMIESARVYQEHDNEERNYNVQDEDFDTD